jgi:extradiol dioxygenase family protein
MSSNRFHLAIAVLDLNESIDFYCNLLGCDLGNFEKDKWQDINFWGNELTLHETNQRIKKGPERERHFVDMGKVCIPHFGIHLNWENYITVKSSIQKTVGFLDQPYTRFKNQETEQETFFVEDTNFNVIEIKSVKGSYYKNKEYT